MLKRWKETRFLSPRDTSFYLAKIKEQGCNLELNEDDAENAEEEERIDKVLINSPPRSAIEIFCKRAIAWEPSPVVVWV